MSEPGKGEWWSLLAPVAVSIECVGRSHTLRWLEGRLVATDHPDADRERALVALGAEPYPCLELIGAWNRHDDDLAMLVLAPRRRGEPIGVGTSHEHVDATSRASLGAGLAARGGWLAGPFTSRTHPLRRLREGSSGADDTSRLISVGHGLIDRLAATVIATWAGRIEHGDPQVDAQRAALRAALYGRALDVVRAWTGDPEQAVDVVMIGPDATPSARRSTDGCVRLELPFSWLRDVWVPGLAVSFGHLIVAATPQSPGWALSATDHEWGGLRPITVAW